MHIIKATIFSVFLSFNALASDAFVDTHPAEQVVRNTTDKVLAVLDKQQDSQQINQLINDIILPNFNFLQMSKWALGKEWKKLDEAKQAIFVSNFQQLLVNTYATALIKFDNESIEVQQAKFGKNKNIALIPTVIILKNARPMLINYTMMNGEAGWQVVDMSISGVSLIRNYRATYASEIRTSGFDSLMEKIIQKNELAGL